MTRNPPLPEYQIQALPLERINPLQDEACRVSVAGGISSLKIPSLFNSCIQSEAIINGIMRAHTWRKEQ
ncbi:MAG: hypothetical protein AB1393_06975 [Candidatus Edwardsbacteria bacterium]